MPAPRPRPRQKLPPRNPARACRHAAFAVRRDLRGAVPDPGLRLRQRRQAERGSRRRARLPVLALRQSHRHDVRGAHGAARRRRGRAGAATGMAAVTIALMGRSRPATMWWPRALFGSCRCRRGSSASVRRRPRLVHGPTSRPGATPCGPTPRPASSRARPIRRSKSSTSPRSPSRTRSARCWWSTTCLPPRSCRSRCAWRRLVVYSATKHIDGQGRCWAASSWAPSILQDEVYPSRSAIPARAIAVQRLGAAQRPRTLASACGARARRRRGSPTARRPSQDHGLPYPGRADHPQYEVAAAR